MTIKAYRVEYNECIIAVVQNKEFSSRRIRNSREREEKKGEKRR